MIGEICYSNEKEVLQALLDKHHSLSLNYDHVSIIYSGMISSPLDSADGRMYEFIYTHGLNNGVHVPYTIHHILIWFVIDA